jgi:hypothetical protein
MRSISFEEATAVGGGDDDEGITVYATRLPPDSTGAAFASAVGAIAGFGLCAGVGIPTIGAAGAPAVAAAPLCTAAGAFVGNMVANASAGSGSPGGSTFDMEYQTGSSPGNISFEAFYWERGRGG